MIRRFKKFSQSNLFFRQMERLFLPVSAESLFALEGFRAMQKFLPNTVPDFLIFLTLSLLSILQKNPRFFLARACLLNFLLNSFPKKIFQISSPSPCDNLTKNRWFQLNFEFSPISNLYNFSDRFTRDQGWRLFVWNCRQAGHQEVTLSATSDYR